MARKVRIEYAGACYHVINRGNYRSWIFESEGARKSFLKCLVECCLAQGWRLHGWVLMGNHYHLCLETPEANLVEGMKWLQGTFANRFNRFRKVNGHVFQGRYKAILLEADAVGAVCNYIHLNPVRAGLVAAAELENYAASSFHQLWHPSKRWSFLEVSRVLEEAGGLADTPKGRRSYRDYLVWLSEDDEAMKRMGFDRMCRGWVLGSKDFRKAVLNDLADEVSLRVVEAEAEEIREPHWERRLRLGLEALGKSEADLSSGRKGSDWKVALARYMRESCLVPNKWLAERMNMGTAKSVSSRVSLHRRSGSRLDDPWAKLKMLECVD
jgi:putative transposase